MPAPGDQYRDTSASINPFMTPQKKIDVYTAVEIANLQSRLDKQLGPEYISTRQGAGGGKVHYLAGEKAINLANDVFGFNGWSSSIQNVQVDFVDEHPQTGKITLGLSTIVRVTLRDGTFHEDIGYGHIENCKGKAAAFEKAKKEATTDALKRALRNFGNVLGNCLYDKDYLQKVTKLKSGPSRWDQSNLHRHPDFRALAPMQGADSKSEVQKANAVVRTESAQSKASMISFEFDDEDGSMFFEEADLEHADEGGPDDSKAMVGVPSNIAASNPPEQKNISRMSSMPQLRQQAAHVSQQPQSRPLARQIMPAAGAHAVSSENPTLPPRAPQTLPQSRLGGQSVTLPQPDGPIQKPNSSSMATVPDFASSDLADATHEHQDVAQQQDQVGRATEGFITARGVEAFNQQGISRPAADLAFDPTKESPSIRRTHGVNHGTSAPIRRDTTNQTNAVASNNIQMSRPASPAAVPQLQRQVPNQPHRPIQAPNQVTASNAGTGQMRHANFVNPSADPSRRIGMPPPAATTPGRSNYRPPTTLKRPALADVSNRSTEYNVDGAGDAKKARVDESVGAPIAVVDSGGSSGPTAST